MSKPTISEYLLSSPEISDLYQRATQSQFLSLAGQGRLSSEILSQWLSQDRLYAQAYVRFAGGLISRVQLPTKVTDRDTSKTLEWRILSLIQTALAGVTRELRFFEEAAEKYGLDLEGLGPVAEGDNLSNKSAGFAPNKATQNYIDLFDSFAAQPRGDVSKTLLDGLVLLWTTEKAYLDSWTYAKRQASSDTDTGADLDGGALRKEFIPNWTSDEFVAFVDECRECLDAYAATQVDDTEEVIAAGSMVLFKKVLVLEESFWPMIA
ncbi:heme oxygenase-like protein [Annulohypoxylon maeteangense]|uniref:heme oxygenase-like protein n=1 Tax=Annulohypoxylon maeteangense TaxID=1927788 RepID=UPI0020076F4D|nr:heme oxygenase-like protein [Annulohypoxylon maeteangense]KAI0889886.1 heme oxygenase-like protein [Annulohypoxylon maeteangense]